MKNDEENADILNILFSNAVKNLRIPDFSDTEPLADNISYPASKAIMKYRNHPSISAIKNKVSGKPLNFLEYLKRMVLRKLKTKHREGDPEHWYHIEDNKGEPRHIWEISLRTLQ